MITVREFENWVVTVEGNIFTVKYRPPGLFGKDYIGTGVSVEKAYLDLPATIRRLAAAERFLDHAKKTGLI